jgi:hypothetical protein
LDPAQRCTAAEALGHDYMADYIEQSDTPPFREQFVNEWLAVKANALKQSPEASSAHQSNKRKAMLLASKAVGQDDDDDDLYDVDDLLGEHASSVKRVKASPSPSI